jgi:hypothetical protein
MLELKSFQSGKKNDSVSQTSPQNLVMLTTTILHYNTISSLF